ncbi:TetR/AcrR family transcriptional regulator [Jatrophihabitans fulvus]
MPDRPSAPYHHGDLRSALIEQSFGLLRETGLAGFSVAALARRLGVSTAAPYRHFSDRSQLLARVAEQAARELTAAMRSAVDAAGPDPVKRFAVTAAVYVTFVSERGAGLELVFAPALRHLQDRQLAEAGRELIGLLRELADAATGVGSAEGLSLIEAHLAMAQGFSTLNRDGFLDQARHSTVAVADRARQASEALARGSRL